MSEHQSESMLTLHEDAFYEFFRPFRHARAQHDIWGGIGLETFGEDLELVKSLQVESVWTVVDSSDDASQWILTGIHTVNRVCYLVTEVAHNWQEIEFRIPSRGYSLTRLGLLRQTNKISRFMSPKVIEQVQQKARSQMEVSLHHHKAPRLS